MSQSFQMTECQPLVGVPVEIKTNWCSYLATLRRSFFGGYEFLVIGGAHCVQISTVRSWRFTDQC